MRARCHQACCKLATLLPPLHRALSRIDQYDVLGNRVADTTGGIQRASYGYDPTTKQVTTVITPQSALPTRIFYDSLGNPSRTVTPLGITSWMTSDGIGRSTGGRTPVDTTVSPASWRYALRGYDVMDRVLSETDSARGPQANTSEQVRLTRGYDDEGNVTSIVRWAVPDAASLSTIETDYTYDPAGRRLTETDPYQPASVQTARWTYAVAIIRVDQRIGAR